MSLAQAQEHGFTTSMDFGLSYNDDAYGISYNYDLGYTVVKGLYIGVGPTVGVGIYESTTSFNAGGYGKIRYTAPLNSTIKPFIDGRVRYSYNMETESGGMGYAVGLGAQLTEKFYLGIYCNMSFGSYTISETKTETYKSGTEYKYGSWWPTYSTRTVTSTETIDTSSFAPMLAFGWIF